MKDEHSDFVNAGESDYADLHKLAEQSGDSAISDMYRIVGERERRSRVAVEKANIVAFPRFRTRAPGDDVPIDLGQDAADGGNVVKFRWRYT